MGTNLWQCTLMVTLQYCLTGTPGHRDHDLLSHSVTLSWHLANQSLPYSNNVKHRARQRSIYIFKVIVLTQPGFERAGSKLKPAIFGFHNLPKEAGTLFIQPPRLVGCAGIMIFLSGETMPTRPRWRKKIWLVQPRGRIWSYISNSDIGACVKHVLLQGYIWSYISNLDAGAGIKHLLLWGK